jgi:hypothetical protein
MLLDTHSDGFVVSKLLKIVIDDVNSAARSALKKLRANDEFDNKSTT